MMRASDRDRERAVALLRARCVEGYLSVETFEYRLGRALRARSAGELRALVADIARSRRPWRRWRVQPTPPAAHVSLPIAGTIIVGRSRGCDVVMTEPTVSRHHLELRAVDQAVGRLDLEVAPADGDAVDVHVEGAARSRVQERVVAHPAHHRRGRDEVLEDAPARPRCAPRP